MIAVNRSCQIVKPEGLTLKQSISETVPARFYWCELLEPNGYWLDLQGITVL